MTKFRPPLEEVISYPNCTLPIETLLIQPWLWSQPRMDRMLTVPELVLDVRTKE